MTSASTLLLQRKHVASLLSMEACMHAVEQAFRLYALGKAAPPKILGLHADKGGFHIKAGILNLKRPYFVAKVNANFPENQRQFKLPTIQGVIVVCDAVSGRLLALTDSIEITIVRTGAATGIAAKYLANKNAAVATICGCGNQGKVSLKALLKVRNLRKIYAFDTDSLQAEKLKQEFENEIDIDILDSNSLPNGLQQSQIVVSCTPSKKAFIHTCDILPGTFIAAVGADNEEKQELDEDLLVLNKVVTDITQQCATIGELHHAIEKGLMNISSVYAELGEIIAGNKPGRESDNEIIIFDSTGTALQDVAIAAIVYESAVANGVGVNFDFVG